MNIKMLRKISVKDKEEATPRRGPFTCSRCKSEHLGFALAMVYQDGEEVCAHCEMDAYSWDCIDQRDWPEDEKVDWFKKVSASRRWACPLPNTIPAGE